MGCLCPAGAAQQVLPDTKVAQESHGQLVQPTAGTYAWQLPLAQTSSTLHALPQPPQLSGSDFWFTQPPSQLSSAAGHFPLSHLPSRQFCGLTHALPHVPQLARSAFVSTHVVPQRVSPGRHEHLLVPSQY